jgi:hypothetical protein
MPRNTRKFRLLAGASALAMGMGLAATSANAFNEVNWTWDAHIDETITKTVDITIDIDLDSLTMVELYQLQVGDVTASSSVTNIQNNQPNGGVAGGTQEVDLGTLFFSGNYNPGTGAVSETSTVGSETDPEFLNGSVNPGAPFGVVMNFDLGTIEVEWEPEDGVGPFDAAVDLAHVVSEATAVGNNANIASGDDAVQLHVEQTVMGADNFDSSFGGSLASISADSFVQNILNASVESTATAVSNNLNVEVASEGPESAMIADFTQLSYANVSATSTVADVSLNNYFNLAAVNPVVSSVATAVGNNANINVNVGE